MSSLTTSLFTFGTVCLAAPGFTHAAEPAWMVDLPAALTEAARQKKPVLANFTGSDWCTACIKLRREVLGAPAFLQWAEKRFIFVEIDIPQGNILPADQLKRNQQTAEHYGVAGFPTIMVLRPDGKVVGGFHGYVNGTKPAIAALEQAEQVARLFEQAATLNGQQKAEVLMEAYRIFPRGKAFAKHRHALEAEIARHDTNNTTGIAAVLQAQAQAERFKAERAATPLYSAEYGRLLDRQLAEALEPNLPSTLEEKCQHSLGTAQSIQDLEQTKQLYQKLIKVQEPQEAAQTQQYLDNYFRDLPALLNMLQQHHN